MSTAPSGDPGYQSVRTGSARVQDSGRMMKQMREAAQRASGIMDGIVQASRA